MQLQCFESKNINNNDNILLKTLNTSQLQNYDAEFNTIYKFIIAIIIIIIL